MEFRRTYGVVFEWQDNREELSNQLTLIEWWNTPRARLQPSALLYHGGDRFESNLLDCLFDVGYRAGANIETLDILRRPFV